MNQHLPSNDTVDVLIPVYNARKTVRRAIASIQAQTYTELRIIVVDDGSSDGTSQVLQDIAAADPRVTVLHQENRGIVDALNNGLSLCRAEYLARHDADDIAYPERFEIQLDYLNRNPDCIAVGSAVRHIDAEDRPTGSYGLISLAQADEYWVPAREPYLIHPFLMIRRQALEDARGYRHVHHAEDADLYWRLRSRGRLHNLPDVLGDYRLHSESISGSSLHNMRLMATSSQLAALSARRRSAGVADLEFDKAFSARLRAKKTLAQMVEVAGSELSLDERAYLELATAAKAIELATYRPYELELSDCEFIGHAAQRGLSTLVPENRRLLIRQLAGTAARLTTQGACREARCLVSKQIFPQYLLRYALRVILPSRLRQRMRRRFRGEGAVK